MTQASSVGDNQVDLYDGNSEPRCPLMLLLDISGSMEGEPINALNQGLVKLARSLSADPITCNRVEVAVITFGGTVIKQTGFQRPEDFMPESYEADGGTPMGEAILTSLRLIEEQKAMYKSQGIEYYRPVMLAICDGKPTDEDTFAEAVEALREAEAKKKVSFYAVGVLGADMALLKSIHAANAPVYLKGVEFTTMFKNLANSIAAEPTDNDQIAVKLQ